MAKLYLEYLASHYRRLIDHPLHYHEDEHLHEGAIGIVQSQDGKTKTNEGFESPTGHVMVEAEENLHAEMVSNAPKASYTVAVVVYSHLGPCSARSKWQACTLPSR